MVTLLPVLCVRTVQSKIIRSLCEVWEPVNRKNLATIIKENLCIQKGGMI